MYDIAVRNGMIYDGSGATPYVGDLTTQDDQIAVVGTLSGAHNRTEIDARRLAVAPGFVNMLSHAQQSLIVDGRSQSDIRQGVTLDVMGEGLSSMGPVLATCAGHALSIPSFTDRRAERFVAMANFFCTATFHGKTDR